MYKQEFKPRFPMNLQFFAESDGAGTNDGNSDGTGTGEGNGDGVKTGADDGTGASSFDDLLKDPKNQSEFDKKVAKALEKAKSKWEAEATKKIEDAKTEAEKLAKMNADQKAEYERQKSLEELAKREKDINTRELKAQAYETLAEKGLPKDLANILNYESAETCNQSIEAVQKAFQSAVEKAVNERLRGGTPPKGAQGGMDAFRAQIAKAVKGQI
ncbi:DUF4355 domain-containing protein [Candidatus Galacturonibacter soehngenii]|uniref:DUF4355 domain-containing protein n=1 Tax=Candidatus Galacturonatibacter soehngenii TaxID=2307010 RepID=A0A7V7UAZ5_9FIRM|nr:DUF4355 domain-containing protein [Candidatus Galacturonibacter soehngenii]KAB1437568.1 DUF4355 domain-containing protein [Candidatus Galacturonibacter soehngenii]